MTVWAPLPSSSAVVRNGSAKVMDHAVMLLLLHLQQ